MQDTRADAVCGKSEPFKLQSVWGKIKNTTGGTSLCALLNKKLQCLLF